MALFNPKPMLSAAELGQAAVTAIQSVLNGALTTRHNQNSVRYRVLLRPILLMSFDL